ILVGTGLAQYVRRRRRRGLAGDRPVAHHRDVVGRKRTDGRIIEAPAVRPRRLGGKLVTTGRETRRRWLRARTGQERHHAKDPSLPWSSPRRARRGGSTPSDRNARRPSV